MTAAPVADQRTGRQSARYDGHAAFYDDLVSRIRAEHTGQVTALVLAALGPPDGICVDLGCGTGVVTEAVARAGWPVVGVDLSADQLAIGRATGRLHPVVRADATTNVPLPPGSAAAVISTYTHTDVDDWAGFVRVAARLLRPGGRLVYVGGHPCFVGPHAQRQPAGGLLVYPGYYHSPELVYDGPGLTLTCMGLRRRVGTRQLSLSRLLRGVLAAGLTVQDVAEDGGDPPSLLAVTARRTA